MSGVVYQFGQTALPQHAAQWTNPAAVRARARATPGGAYDPERGGITGLKLPFDVTVNALALSALAQTAGATLADKTRALGATLDGYRALLGQRDRLWLDPLDTAQTDRWCWAKLVDIAYQGAATNRAWQPVTLTFECLTPWQGHSYGGAWDLDSGYLFDSGLFLDGAGATALAMNPITLTVPNAGNRAVTNAGLVLTAGDGPVTSVRVQGPGTDWTWRGTLAAGKALLVDCGAKRVLNDGANAYAGFALGANHARGAWLVLEPGSNSVILTVDNIGEFTAATVQLTYADGWI